MFHLWPWNCFAFRSVFCYVFVHMVVRLLLANSAIGQAARASSPHGLYFVVVVVRIRLCFVASHLNDFIYIVDRGPGSPRHDVRDANTRDSTRNRLCWAPRIRWMKRHKQNKIAIAYRSQQWSDGSTVRGSLITCHQCNHNATLDWIIGGEICNHHDFGVLFCFCSS